MIVEIGRELLGFVKGVMEQTREDIEKMPATDVPPMMKSWFLARHADAMRAFEGAKEIVR